MDDGLPVPMDDPQDKNLGNTSRGDRDEEWSTPFLAPPAHSSLIGRNDLVRGIKALLFANRSRPVLALTHLPGVGKTALAIHLANDPDVKQHFPDGVLWVTLGRSPNVQALMGEWMLALGFTIRDISASRNDSVKEGFGKIMHKIHDRRLLLVLDDVWEAKTAQEFLVGGPYCAHLVTSRLVEQVNKLPNPEIVNVPELRQEDGLALLNQLAPRAVQAEPEQAANLVDSVGGLPLALVLMGKYLWKESISGQPRRIRSALAKLADAEKRLSLERPVSLLADVPTSLMASIQISDEALDPAARQALRNLSISHEKPPRFTIEFAETVGWATAEDIENLVDAGLLEEDREYEQQERESMTGSGPLEGLVAQRDVLSDTHSKLKKLLERRLFRLPRTIADYARIQAGGYLEEFHRRAADYYKGWLRQFEETTTDVEPYLRQFRYVHPHWLRSMSNFLYHLAYTEPDYANLQLARLYFDAFWWWGCYRDFPFCTELLEQWQEKRTSSEDQQWLRLVTKFHRSYPTGYDKHGKGDWQAVEAALLELRGLGAMDGDRSALDENDPEGQDRLHVRGITDIFLAESRRYRDPSDPMAGEYLDDTLAIFAPGAETNADDAWNVPWVLWHQGDFLLERGQWDEALAKVADSRRLAIAGGEDACVRDHEIIANDYRVEGDVEWQRGNIQQAFTHYAGALTHAYLFLGCPLPPNFYTVDFYCEMRTRTLERLQELLARNLQDELTLACTYLHDFWQPYWQVVQTAPPKISFVGIHSAGDLVNLADHLFPALPTKDDMQEGEGSAYVDRIYQLVNLMQDRINREFGIN